MNNPFLSDRNIFSKVVNPMKKKQVEKKQPVSAEQNGKKEPFINVPYMARYEHQNQKPSYAVATSNTNAPQPKMTFGKPNQTQERISFDNRYYSSSGMNTNKGAPQEKDRQYNNRNEIGRMAQNSSYNYQKSNYQSVPMEQKQYEFTSPAQDSKFQEYKRNNNFKDYSPIAAQPQRKGNDSQFLNIDALGDDINKFLADSKNQEELCQILGINRQPPQMQQNMRQDRNIYPRQLQRRQPDRRQLQRRQIQARQIQKRQNQKRQNDRRQIQRRQRERRQIERRQMERRQYEREQERRQYEKRQYEKRQQQKRQQQKWESQRRQSQNIMSAFARQKPSVARGSEPVELMPNVPKVLDLQDSKQYIPTFKYMGVQNQNQTFSREEDPKVLSSLDYQKSQNKDDKDNIEVFDYSRVNSTQQEKTVQELITEQMNILSINGKYRTFLTASEKIVTVRYNLQPL